MLTAKDARETLDNHLLRIFDIIKSQIRCNLDSFIFFDESFPYNGDKLSKQQINALLNLGYFVERDTLFFGNKNYEAWKVSW
jgi:hypothetical protein